MMTSKIIVAVVIQIFYATIDILTNDLHIHSLPLFVEILCEISNKPTTLSFFRTEAPYSLKLIYNKLHDTFSYYLFRSSATRTHLTVWCPEAHCRSSSEFWEAGAGVRRRNPWPWLWLRHAAAVSWVHDDHAALGLTRTPTLPSSVLNTPFMQNTVLLCSITLKAGVNKVGVWLDSKCHKMTRR